MSCILHNTPCAVVAVGPDHILAERHFVILLSTLTLTLPLSLYRNVEKLGKVRWPFCRYRVMVSQLPVKHPRVSPGVPAVNGADTYHPRGRNHQGRFSSNSNV